MNKLTELSNYWPELKKLAQSILKDEQLSDDILQESYIKAITKASQLKQTSSLLAWFKTIVRNAAYDTLRKKQREQKAKSTIDIETIAKQEEFEKQSCECLIQLIKELPDKDQAIITDYDIKQKPYEELSKHYKTSRNTLKVRLHRARKKLKRAADKTLQDKYSRRMPGV